MSATFSPARVVRKRVDGVPAWALMVQLFIGLGWIRAAVEKVIAPTWWSGEELSTFLATHEALPWFAPFLDLAVAPMLVIVSTVVVVLEAALGAMLLLGRRPGPTLTVGIALNLVFIAAGAVTPSVFYVLAQGSVLLWLVERHLPVDADDRLGRATVAALGLAALNVGFIRTLAPADVIEDPAIILVTVGLLVSAAAWLIADRRVMARGAVAVFEPVTPRMPRPVRSSVTDCRTAVSEHVFVAARAIA